MYLQLFFWRISGCPFIDLTALLILPHQQVSGAADFLLDCSSCRGTILLKGSPHQAINEGRLAVSARSHYEHFAAIQRHRATCSNSCFNSCCLQNQ